MAKPRPEQSTPRSGRSSRAKVAANRANAGRSTGPKTSAGKETAARNALRHGLAVSVSADRSVSAKVERLACLIAGEGADAALLALARPIAEAQIDLDRIRAVRFRRMARDIDDPEYRSEAALWEVLAINKIVVKNLLTAVGLDFAGAPDDSEIQLMERSKQLLAPMSQDNRTAAVLADAAQELARLDRYEARALSRRKKAIREFDAMRFTPSEF